MAIYVIEDHPLMRDAMVMLVRRVRPGAAVAELAQLSELAEAIAAHGPPELFCLDLKLPDTPDLSGVSLLKSRFPDTPLAVISATPAADVEDACREAGADIYLEKSAGASEITAALRALLADGPLDDGEGGESVPAANTKLSRRQQQLIGMLDRGLSNRDIAAELGISEHTVKVHLWRLFKRLGVKSRTQTLHFARQNGLLNL
jgi:DNA-binding NarL/FixJ family response regulator